MGDIPVLALVPDERNEQKSQKGGGERKKTDNFEHRKLYGILHTTKRTNGDHNRPLSSFSLFLPKLDIIVDTSALLSFVFCPLFPPHRFPQNPTDDTRHESLPQSSLLPYMYCAVPYSTSQANKQSPDMTKKKRKSRLVEHS